MRSRLLTTVVALLAFGAACAHSEELTKLSVSYSATSDFMPTFIAKDTGIFEKHGLDVTLVNLATTSLGPPSLQAGSLQIASISPALLLLANDGGMDLVAVANVAAMDARDPHSGFMTRPGFNPTKASDFIGKTIGRPGINSAFDLLVKKWLLDRGVKLDQVKIVETPFGQMGDLLKAGQIDAAIAVEPLLTRVINSGSAQRSIDFISEIDPHIVAAIFGSTREWATANHATLEKFRASVAEGMAFMKDHKAESDAISQKRLGLAGTPAAISMDLKPSDFDIWISIAKELKLLQQPVDDKKLILN